MIKRELQGFTINDRYTVGPSLGEGAFGEVYIVYDIEQEKMLALKKEEQKIKIPQLINQYRILKMLEGVKGFPNVYYYGFQLRSNVCIMDLLGPSLQDLLQICKIFSLKTVLMLAEDMIDRIQVLHAKGYLYRDIKPQNFVMGLQKNSHKLYLIDFGLCKRYKDFKSNQHFMYKEKKNVVGTLRYASINSHLGIQYSRRDDLEAIGYLLIYLATGELPWMGITAENKVKRGQKILQMKLQLPIQVYTQGLPSEFCTYLNYCRALKFSERPDYDFLKRLFSDLLKNAGFLKDYDYDWCQCQKNDFKNSRVKIELNKKQDGDNKSESDDNSVYNVYGNRRDSNAIAEDEIRLGISSNSGFRKSEYNEGDQNIDPDLLDDSQMRLISKRSKWFESTL